MKIHARRFLFYLFFRWQTYQRRSISDSSKSGGRGGKNVSSVGLDVKPSSARRSTPAIQARINGRSLLTRRLTHPICKSSLGRRVLLQPPPLSFALPLLLPFSRPRRVSSFDFPHPLVLRPVSAFDSSSCGSSKEQPRLPRFSMAFARSIALRLTSQLSQHRT